MIAGPGFWGISPGASMAPIVLVFVLVLVLVLDFNRA